MLWACGVFGCIGHAFKRSPSTTSSGFGEHPGHNHHLGDHRHQHGDRHHHRNGRGGRVNSHTGMTSGGAQAAGSSSSAAPGDPEPRLSPADVYGGSPAQVLQYGSEENQAGSAAAAAAIAAATQPASLVKLERGGASRRTPLHVAAERGQLHVLSAIIENLCCTATAALLDNGSGGNGNSDSGGITNPGRSSSNTGAATDAGSGAGSRSSQGQAQVQGTSRRSHRSGAGEGGGQAEAPESPDRATSRAQEQQSASRSRGNGLQADEFPVARPGAGGAPLAPEQYIQYHLNMQDADGTTALSLACRFGHVDCCRLLLANGSARTLSDARGNTPLHYAALRGHLGVLFMLLDEFLEPGQEEELSGYADARNHAGCTPLHYAVWGRQSGSVQVLLQHGADVLPRNSRPAQELTPPVMVVGSTPLHLAAARGHVEICRIILKTFAERVLEPLQLTEDDPQPPTLASLDPRVQVNANGHMPYQVAQRLGFYPLAMLLRPSIPILRLFSDEERAVRFYGPAPLRAIAAEALNKKLLAELDALAAAAATPTTAGNPGGAAAAAAAPQGQEAAGGSGNGNGGGSGSEASAGGAQQPVSAPGTLEQLAAMEAEDELAAAAEAAQARQRGSGPGGEAGARATSPFTQSAAAEAAAASAGGSNIQPGGVARRLTPPPPLQVLAGPQGSTREGSRQPESPQPAPPRTPAMAGSPGGPLSPGGISPRLMSPISRTPASPSPGPTSSTSLVHTANGPQLQLPSRGSSAAQRTTPPQLSSNRSSNAMLSAPIAAGMSRPPSAPRSNGLHASPSRGQVMVSLPGQPDIPEHSPLSPSGLPPGAAEQMVPGGMSDAGGGSADGEGVYGDGSMGGGADASGTGAGVYAPRTPVRQPSSSALHVRRTPASPTPGAASPSAAAGGAGEPSATAAVRRSGDGGRPPGLIRLRSNPLFEDVQENASGSNALGRGPAATTTGLTSAAVSAMPSLAEGSAEGEDGPSSDAGATVASSCAAVTPFNRPPGSQDSTQSGATTSSSAAPPAREDASASAGVQALAAASSAIAAVLSYATSDGDDEELECGVCMEPLPMVAIAPCRHQVCGPCARRICCLNIQKPSHCPFCRATISAFVAPAATAS